MGSRKPVRGPAEGLFNFHNRFRSDQLSAVGSSSSHAEDTNERTINTPRYNKPRITERVDRRKSLCPGSLRHRECFMSKISLLIKVTIMVIIDEHKIVLDG